MIEQVDAGRQKDIEFLSNYLRELREEYEASEHLVPDDLFFGSYSEEEQAEYETTQERVARLADANGFDGTLFRDYLFPGPPPLSVEAIRKLQRKIETVPRIIAKLEESNSVAPRPAVSDETKLLSAKQVATMLGRGESTVRDLNQKGLLPKPTQLGGSIRWGVDEINAWVKHRCPPRAEWERIRDKCM